MLLINSIYLPIWLTGFNGIACDKSINTKNPNSMENNLINPRDTIFISHATPEDNEFAIWLASRLEFLGYKVWVDKNQLLGGERFWTDIEDAIKNKSIKFLLVYSDSLKDSNNDQIKPGIQKEIDFAKEVITANPNLVDFLTVLRIDKSPYNLFPESQDINQIHFDNNWAEGLTVLLKKLQRDNVPTFNFENQNSFAEWYLEHYIIKNPIIEKKELYYTNWWCIKSMPNQFYIYRFANQEQARAVFDVNKDSISVVNANCITTFKKELVLDLVREDETINLIPSDVHEVKVNDLLVGYERETFPTQRDASNFFKKLLKRSIHVLLRKIRLNWYELANKNLAYYHTTESLPKGKVTFAYPHRKLKSKRKTKKKNLIGKYLTVGKWHFAVSFKTMLDPYLGFKLKSHIIFTSDGSKALSDPEFIHSHRRKKGKRMFNEEWRDLLLAFLSSLKNNKNQISIEVAPNEKLIMNNCVELFWSDHGYYDPKDIERQNIFTYEDEDDTEAETESGIEPELELENDRT